MYSLAICSSWLIVDFFLLFSICSLTYVPHDELYTVTATICFCVMVDFVITFFHPYFCGFFLCAFKFLFICHDGYVVTIFSLLFLTPMNNHGSFLLFSFLSCYQNDIVQTVHDHNLHWAVPVHSSFNNPVRISRSMWFQKLQLLWSYSRSLLLQKGWKVVFSCFHHLNSNFGYLYTWWDHAQMLFMTGMSLKEVIDIFLMCSLPCPKLSCRHFAASLFQIGSTLSKMPHWIPIFGGGFFAF